MESILALLAAYGLCFGMMNGKVSLVNRVLYALPIVPDERGYNFFERMLACAYCTGFWSGWLVWLVWRVGSDTVLSEGFVFAFASSAFCYSLDTTLRRLEK